MFLVYGGDLTFKIYYVKLFFFLRMHDTLILGMSQMQFESRDKEIDKVSPSAPCHLKTMFNTGLSCYMYLQGALMISCPKQDVGGETILTTFIEKMRALKNNCLRDEDKITNSIQFFCFYCLAISNLLIYKLALKVLCIGDQVVLFKMC